MQTPSSSAGRFAHLSAALLIGSSFTGSESPVQRTPAPSVTVSLAGRSFLVPAPGDLVVATPDQWEQLRATLAPGKIARPMLAFVPAELEGRLPSEQEGYSRGAVLSLILVSKEASASLADFEELKEVMVSSETKAAAQRKIEQRITAEGVDVPIAAAQILEPHLNDSRVFGFSLLTEVPAEVGSMQVCTSQVFVLAKARVVQLALWGAGEDLEWTRKTSEAWAERMLEANPGDRQTLAEEMRPDPLTDSLSTLVAVVTLGVPLFFFGRYRAKKNGWPWPKAWTLLVVVTAAFMLGVVWSLMNRAG